MLLASARDEFGRHGYAGTTLEAVATKAGVAKPMLYRHFDSKEALHASVLIDAAQHMQERVRSALTHAGPEVDRAHACIDTTFDYLEHDAFAWRVLTPEDVGDSAVSIEANQVVRSLAARQAMVLLRCIRPDLPGSLEPVTDRERLWTAMALGLQSNVAQWWLEHPAVQRPAVVEDVLGSVRVLAALQ